MDILERISEYFQGENDENHRKLLRDAMGTIRELRADKPATVDSTCPRWVPLPKPGVTVTTGPQTQPKTYSIHKTDPFSLFGGIEPVLGGIYAHKVSRFVTDGIGGPKVTAVLEYVRIG